MVSAQSPLLFIISEPVGSSAANEVAYRLAEHGVRTWIGSLAPAGELKDSAMHALRSSAAALLVFDEAAARSRDVDRHLLVARQTGKPLIPLRLQAVDEGLLRQELLDAQWIDASAPGAMAEVSRRAAEYDRAQREQGGMGSAGAVGAGAAAGAVGAAAVAGADQGSRRPRIEVLPGAPAPAAEPEAPRRVAAAPSGGGLMRSPTMLIALLALVVVVGAVLYTMSRSGDDRDQASRTVTERQETAEYTDEPAAVQDEPLPQAEEVAPVAEPETPASAPTLPATAAPVPTQAQTPPQVAPPARPAPTPAQPEEAEEPEAEAAPSGSSAVAAVRSFYGALSRGDGASAAQFVVPGKRSSGPLSGAALSRYYSSFRRPLRLRSVAPVDANRVRVAYDYVLADGRLCQGQAVVDVVQSGGKGLVGGIRTQGPC